ncbi:MAG: TonB-dependent receptor plug domain-containing protein, partial [Tannerellaceae bacterium]|nr:TonB-dependent receptor plug domain-containing protein [Tannerellaceae bacterium]
MRITTLLLTLCLFCAHAADTHSQNARVSISKKVTSLDEILNEIESQTDYLFIYNNQVNVNRSVSVKVKNKPVSYVLDNLLKKTDINYSMEGTHIVLTRKESPVVQANVPVVQQNTKTITGVVTDNKGETIIGANVVEKGTSNGTTTNINGRFTLNVSPGALLTVSYVGYLPQEVSVANQTSLTIELREDSRALDEVVVIGYGSVKKSDLTGSVASVSSRSFRDQPITRVEDAIQGRMAGVDVQAISGAPGSEIKIRVRGASSINKSNDPLYVVDGIVSSSGLAGINPADISSIEVLKDASSTAIYGSRGANGVVLITPTRGSSEPRIVTFDAEMGFSNVPRKYDLLSAYESGLALNDIRGYEVIGAADMEAYKNGSKGIDWQDVIFRTG